MNTLVLKLVLSPLLIQAATLAGRRWGEGVSGWFVGLPLTSGPVVFFLALDQGTAFAADAATGSLAGTAAQAGFCIAYGLAARFGWPAAMAAASAAFAAGAVALAATAPSRGPLLPFVLAALAVAVYAVTPRASAGTVRVRVRRRWDLWARMLVAVALVLVLTSAAPHVGATASGLLATYPIFAATLAVFAHRADGERAARLVLRGLLLGLFGFAGFFFVLGLLLPRAGAAAAFAAAGLVALTIQGASLKLVRRGGG